MSFVTTVAVSHPDLPLAPTARCATHATLSIECPSITCSNASVLFVAVRCEDFDTFEAAIGTDPTVVTPLVVAGSDVERVYQVSVATEKRLVAPGAIERGARVLGITSVPAGAWHVRLQIPGREPLVAFRRYCEREGIDFELTKMHESAGPAEGIGIELTPAQREAIAAAYEAGYYDDPRGVSLRDLGERLGVSSSAVSRRLRRAHGRLAASVLSEGDGGA